MLGRTSTATGAVSLLGTTRLQSTRCRSDTLETNAVALKVTRVGAAQDSRRALKRFAGQQQIPITRFEHGERKDKPANRIRRKRPVRDEVVFIGAAREKAMAFSGKKVNGQLRSVGSCA